MGKGRALPAFCRSEMQDPQPVILLWGDEQIKPSPASWRRDEGERWPNLNEAIAFRHGHAIRQGCKGSAPVDLDVGGQHLFARDDQYDGGSAVSQHAPSSGIVVHVSRP